MVIKKIEMLEIFSGNQVTIEFDDGETEILTGYKARKLKKEISDIIAKELNL